MKLTEVLKNSKLISSGATNQISDEEKTSIKTGDFHHKDYSRHDYDVNRFVVEASDKEIIDFEKALLKTIKFWKTKIE